MSKQELPTIDPAALAQVSGGTTISTATTGNDQILTALNGIITSLQSISQQSGGGFGGGGLNQQELLTFLLLSQRNQQSGYAASPWGWGQPTGFFY